MCDKTGLKHSLIGNHEKFIVDKDFDNHLYNGGEWALNEFPEYTDRQGGIVTGKQIGRAHV